MKLSRTIILALLVVMAGVIFSCDEKDQPKPPTPPAAPVLLAILEFTRSTVDMSWSDQSVDEDGFRIERKQDTTAWVTDGSIGSDSTYYQSTGLLAGASYTFRVFAYNEAGDSGPSNERIVTTVSDELPLAPTMVEAVALSSSTIEITWNDRDDCDSFQVNRRTDATDWARVARTPDDIEVYLDTLLTEGTAYYYRVGAVNQSGTAWSDSAVATTPIQGSPAPPTDLRADIVPGHGVRLTWLDHSTDELGFIISRGETGHQFADIDTTEVNATAHYDSLREFWGEYNYRVRAYNQHGDSEPIQLTGINYNFCSDGVIPLCYSPRYYWRYMVHEEEPDTTYEIERLVAAVTYLADYDHYLIVEHPFGIDHFDSLIYLRNFTDEGCRGVAWPLNEYSSSELLFQYPVGNIGSSYTYHGDSVLVIQRGTTMTVEGVVYTGVVGYQRFLRGTGRSIRYWVKPLDQGIIREEEVVSSEIVLTRDLSAYWGD